MIEPARVAGLLLAAGSGRRYGRPKALADTGSGPWVLRAVSALDKCDPRLVVVGARGDQVAALLPATVQTLDNPGHADGMGSSLRLGLLRLSELAIDSDPPIDAALIMLVDLPGVGAPVVARLLSTVGPPPVARRLLGRAAFGGEPGHPVLIGRDHWAGVIDSAHGDNGARDYLRAHPARLVECGDVGSGEDVDEPPAR